MLASNADVPPLGAEWLSEIKFDGYRVIIRKDGDDIRVLTRNGLDWTHRLSAVARAAARLPAETLLADGELVSLQPDGLSSFPDLQAALKEGRTDSLHLYLFDLLYQDGHDLRDLPLTERKAALVALVPEQDFIRVSDHLEGITDQVRKNACAMGLEGIICKRADSAYHAGRSRDWLKIKCQGREEFLILGWTPPQGSRTGLGSLQLGFHDEAGKLHYIGGCGSGFTDATLQDLAAQLKALATDAARPAPAYRGEAARRILPGSSRPWSPKSSSPAGPAPAACAMPCSSACARTNRPPKWFAKSLTPKRNA